MTDRTFALERCEACPPVNEMPTVALVRGACPRCGAPVDGRAAARVLRARRLVDELGVTVERRPVDE